jgi:hypothetical protein|tara:strand:+ start:168 stop:521 length:354 start_codon:yes stop_codon:yes gene_type:complete
MEKGFLTADVSFCAPQQGDSAGNQPGLLATATALRVDIWKLQQKEKKKEGVAGDDFDYDDDQIEPFQSLRRFTETVTAVKLREDGQVIVAGDRMGKIELIEIKQKIALRTYTHEHKN